MIEAIFTLLVAQKKFYTQICLSFRILEYFLISSKETMKTMDVVN